MPTITGQRGPIKKHLGGPGTPSGPEKKDTKTPQPEDPKLDPEDKREFTKLGIPYFKILRVLY